MKRPLLPVSLLYVGGILLADLFPPPLLLMFGVALCVAAAALGCERLRVALLFPLIFLAGATNLRLHTAVLSPHDLRRLLGTEPHLVTIRGKLIETPTLRLYEQGDQPSWRMLARVKATALLLSKSEWQPASGVIAITTPGLITNFFCGQFFEVTGVAALPRPAVAEGTFDYRALLKQQGIYYQLKAESENDWRLLRSPSALPLADRFREWGRQALARGLPLEDESLRLEWALALGWKTALTEEASEPFVQAATYHIFAVDGLRMAIIFGIFFSVMRAVGLPRSICGLILLPVIWFYVALTGWPASAIRASIMLTIILVGWARRCPSDPVNSLLAAGLAILVWEPQQLFQAGFQLSFVVVLCLILTIPPLSAIIHRVTAPDPWLPAPLLTRWPAFLAVPGRYLGDLWLTSFAAWIGSLPLVAYYFNIVTPISTPANVIAVPLCVLVLISNMLSLGLANWFAGAAELFNHAGWFGMECIRVSSEWFAKIPAAFYYTPAPSLFTTCLYYALLMSVVTGWAWRTPLRLWKLAVLSMAVVAWLWNFYQQAATTRLTVLPVNGGTAVFRDSFGSKHDLLIDVGPTNAVQFITKPFLRAQGVNQLPALLLSHGDVHHTGGTEPLVQSFEVNRIYSSPVRFRSVAYRRMLERLDRSSGLITNVARDDVVRDWVVLHPGRDERFAKADDGAVVLKTALSGTRILLLSDLGPDGQKALLARAPDLHAEIVVAGLPASGEPLCEPLIEAIHPKVIIISDSDFPISERAGPKLRSRLRRRNIPTLYTRDTGAVTLEFRNGRWKLRTMSAPTERSLNQKIKGDLFTEPASEPE